ncbi:MAG: glycine--tRNA ligase, partial [Bacteroidales bacterium]|nr:glycine--tRNA ligase [Bacteroidales bacterium]
RDRRQDAIVTPYCITVDHQTLEDNTVIILERDSMQQDRIDMGKISGIIADRLKAK